MAITNAFRNAVSEGDVKGIRIMMKDSLLVDPTFIEFNEMNTLARNISGLYEAHDGRELNGDKSAWNDDYMNKLMVQVIGNFSYERINHLKNVVKYLRPAAAHPKPPPKGPDENMFAERNVKIAAGAAGGGVVGGTIAGIAGGSVFIGAVIGAVVVGAVVAIVTNGE